MIDIADQFIAATAHVYGVDVLTYDLRPFRRVRGLTVVDAAEAASGR